MLWNVGLKERDQQMREIWIEKEENLLTLMRSTYLKLELNLLDIMQTSEVFGEKEKMNWNVALQKSRNGHYQKQPKPHLVLAGVRQATQEVYDHSYWNV